MGVFGRASAAHGFCGVTLLAVCWLPYCIALSPGSINYDPIIADPVKGVAKTKDSEAYWTYLKVWAEQGFRFPRTYFDAWASLDAGLFSGRPCKFVTDSLGHVDGMSYVPESTFEKPSGNQAASAFNSTAYLSLVEVPVAGRIIALSTYAVLIPLFCLLSIMRSQRRRILLPVVASILCTLAGVVLSPVTVGIEATRYILPLMYSMPTMLAVARYALQPAAGTAKPSRVLSTASSRA